jgi:ppGpp synthetase/RelA/SpoT-type nucleotidyltranferase
MQGKKNRKKMYPRDEKVKKRIKKIKRMLGEKIQKKKRTPLPMLAMPKMRNTQ